VQVLAFFIYNFVTNFILEPTYQTCFNATLQRLKLDPRITVRLGNDIVGEQQHTREGSTADSCICCTFGAEAAAGLQMLVGGRSVQ
jgi:hypothetical protein